MSSASSPIPKGNRKEASRRVEERAGWLGILVRQFAGFSALLAFSLSSRPMVRVFTGVCFASRLAFAQVMVIFARVMGILAQAMVILVQEMGILAQVMGILAQTMGILALEMGILARAALVAL